MSYTALFLFIIFVQRRPNVEDVVPTLYKCYTNVLCLLGSWLLTGSSATQCSSCSRVRLPPSSHHTVYDPRIVHICCVSSALAWRVHTVPLCKAKRQYLLTLKVSRYRLLASRGSMRGFYFTVLLFSTILNAARLLSGMRPRRGIMDWCWASPGPASKTFARYWSNAGSMCFVPDKTYTLITSFQSVLWTAVTTHTQQRPDAGPHFLDSPPPSSQSVVCATHLSGTNNTLTAGVLYRRSAWRDLQTRLNPPFIFISLHEHNESPCHNDVYIIIRL